MKRPSTAPAVRPRTAQQMRPLGRAVPLRSATSAYGSSPPAVIASIKGEILMVQNRLDAVRAKRGEVAGALSNDMENLEKVLLQQKAVEGDKLATVEAHCTLLEILLQQMKTLGTESLQEAVKVATMSDEELSGIAGDGSRSGAFLRVIDFFNSISERQAVWIEKAMESAADTRPPTAAAEGNTGSGRPATAPAERPAATTADQLHAAAFDTAMNQPVVGELRSLITQQKQLYTQMNNYFAPPQVPVAEESATADVSLKSFPSKGTLSRKESGKKKDDAPSPTFTPIPAPAPVPASTPKAAASRPSLSPKPQTDLNGADTKLIDENASLKKKVQKLEAEVKKLNEALAVDSAEDAARELLKRCNDFAFLTTSKERLADLGITVGNFAPQGVAEENATIAQRMQALIAETIGTVQTDTKKKKNDSGQTGAIEGALWTSIYHQNTVMGTLCSRLEAARADLASEASKHAKEQARLERVVDTLGQRVQSLKESQKKTVDQLHTQLEGERVKCTQLSEDLAASRSAKPQARPVVSVKDQPRSHKEIENSLREQLGRKIQAFDDLASKLDKMSAEVVATEQKSSTWLRERQSTMSRISAESAKAIAKAKECEALQSEVDELKTVIVNLRKELREKSTAESSVQRDVWKMQVELQISQNVISELRSREVQLQQTLKDSKQCQDALRTKLEQQRHEADVGRAALLEKIRGLQTEERISKEAVFSERAKTLAHEKEVERLRQVDSEMELLQQNFTNYAASKLAQQEAKDDEEKLLQGVVEQLMHDVFELPSGTSTEDELEMYHHQLTSRKSEMDTEERQRSKSRAAALQYKDDRSYKKRLLFTLQRRLNAIQLFAVEQRLKQVDVERRNITTAVELSELKVKHESTLVELAQVRAQCDAVVQRNTELELEKQSILKHKTHHEDENKNYKRVIQRMRVDAEEHERMLIDVGSRLQNARMEANTNTAAETSDRKLSHVLVGRGQEDTLISVTTPTGKASSPKSDVSPFGSSSPASPS